MSAFRLSLFAALSLTLASCGDPWKVITASGPPSAIAGKTTFAVQQDFDGLMMGKKSEAEYLAEKDDKTKESFAGDKTGMQDELLKTLKKSKTRTFGETGDVDVKVHYTFIETGTYTPVYAMPTSVIAKVDFAVGGNVVDSIEIVTAQSADIYHPSSGQRMRNCAEQLGVYINAFIEKSNK